VLVISFAGVRDLGTDCYTNRIDKTCKTRNLVHQLQALGQQVTLNPAVSAIPDRRSTPQGWLTPAPLRT
jgi:hypothetical protein